MAITAQEPLTECKVLLNDPNSNIYADDKLIPIMQKAYRELQTKMMLNGLPVLKEQTLATAVNVGTVSLGDGSGLPTDFLYPIELQERLAGSGAQYEDMDEAEWEESITPSDRLYFWTWREETLQFVGALTNREVRIRYMKGLTRIIATTTPIAVNNAVTYLAARTAAIAAVVLGSNPSRGEVLAGDAAGALDELIRILVRREQGIGIRRRVNRYRRR